MTPPGPVYESELTWLSTRELAARIASGEVSAREALTDHLARIDSVDPAINAIVTRDDERAYERAERADARHARGERLGPLHGVPLTHKESTDTAGLRTTRGSPLLVDNVPARDALIIARLRAAGVVTTGKSNVPEFTAGSHTFNPLFGTTVNPYDTTKSAAGSSGGAAAAIAAGIQASGDGSDMGGSLRTPGSFNNVVGLRPSNGRIPHALPADPWKWLAQPGVLARTVDDVALLMAAVCGPAPGAPLSIQEPGSVFDRPEFAEPGRHEPGSWLAGVRVGFSTDLGGLLPVEPAVAAVVGSAAETLAAAGARVDDVLPVLDDADEVFRVYRALDFAADYREIVRNHRDEVKQAVVWNTELGLALTVDEIVAAEEARVRLLASIEDFFSHHDLLVLTTSQVAPFDASLEYPRQIAGTPMRDYLEWMRAATVISATDCPAISVPAGFTPDGLPVGVQLVAAPGKDVELLLAAQAFEELTGHHSRRPAF
ncbi:amidase [Jiangella anatolica]|uniref:Amidase n=1 Tax=Jiangella anatolica TaxID=2670374 RepID=A0A2W2C6C0_9ACTN|nr:amidase family protein [Jiangella anatolica]PZF83627.1 amidase [Jiangella anatolica]